MDFYPRLKVAYTRIATISTSDPEPRRQWQQGDKRKFWPYGKSWKEVFAGATSGELRANPERRGSAYSRI